MIVDADIHDSEAAKEFEERILKQCPQTIVRYWDKGCHLYFKVKEGESFPYAASNSYKDLDGNKAMIEFRGIGRQCVAFGLHDKTHEPTRWRDDRSPANVKVDELPEYCKELQDGVSALFDEIAKARDWDFFEAGATEQKSSDSADNPFKNFKDVVAGMTIEIAREMLEYVVESNFTGDHCYNEWFNAGLALHHQFGDDGAELWHEFSARSELMYDPDVANNKWEEIIKKAEEGSNGAPITIRSLMDRAQKKGWEQPDSLRRGDEESEDVETDGTDALLETAINAVASVVGDYNAASAIINHEPVKILAKKLVSIKGKLSVLTQQNAIETPSIPNTIKMLRTNSGKPIYSASQLREYIKILEADDTNPERLKFLKSAKCRAAIESELVSNITVWAHDYRSTYDGFDLKADPFADKTEITMRNLVTTWIDPILRKIRPVENAPPDHVVEECYEEYIKHNPYFDELTIWLVNCVFAADRKNSFLWLRAPTNFGKSFLFKGVYGALGLIADISADVVKHADGGSPTGLTMGKVHAKMAIVFEEFKHAPDAMRKLQNTFSFSPKNKPQVEVEVHAKVGLSAELVPTLAGQTGVNGQFASRFNHIRIDSNERLEDLPTFKKYGDGVFCRAIQVKARRDILVEAGRLRALGKVESEFEAGQLLKSFHEKHNISRFYGTTDQLLGEYAEQLRDFVIQQSQDRLDNDLSYDFKKAIKYCVITGERGEEKYGRFRSIDRLIEEYFLEAFGRGKSAHYEVSKALKEKDHFINMLYDLMPVERNDEGGCMTNMRFKKQNPCTAVHFLIPKVETGDTEVKGSPFANKEADVIDIKSKQKVA